MNVARLIFCCVITGLLGGGMGYAVAAYRQAVEEANAKRERDACAFRENELRAQLEEALTAQTQLRQENRQLEATFTERIKRLEDIVGAR